jgi:hypothetical protein
VAAPSAECRGSSLWKISRLTGTRSATTGSVQDVKTPSVSEVCATTINRMSLTRP